jgi:beta-glucosidase
MTGTPVALVVVSGRPLAIEWAARNCAAVLLAWVPGDAGPDAIADVLTGVANPGGKLPISVPRHVGQVPVSYHIPPEAGPTLKGDYVDGPTTPLWHFGFGRSYTTFEVSNRIDQPTLATAGGGLTATVDVANTGDRAQRSGPPAPDEATVARPVLELRGFRQSISRAANCDVRPAAEQFATSGDYRRVIEPGTIRLRSEPRRDRRWRRPSS